jgi:type IV pilus assembly protein PilE
MTRSARGLTLIELMVVVAIIGILATIAIVAWGQYVRSSARSDAMAALTDLRVKQEQFRFTNPTYADGLDDFDPDIPATTPNGKYTLALVAGSVTANGYTATATPTGSQSSDTECGTFAINQDGPVTTGTYASARCWKR